MLGAFVFVCIVFCVHTHASVLALLSVCAFMRWIDTHTHSLTLSHTHKFRNRAYKNACAVSSAMRYIYIYIYTPCRSSTCMNSRLLWARTMLKLYPPGLSQTPLIRHFMREDGAPFKFLLPTTELSSEDFLSKGSTAHWQPKARAGRQKTRQD